jgi:hypothetical protein
MDHTLGHRQGAIPDVERQQQFTLGGHGDPDPLGRALQALKGRGRADFTGLDRAEQRKQLIELHLPDLYVMQEVLGEGAQLLRCLDEPLQHGIGVHLEDPCRASDAQPFGQTGDDAYDEIDGCALAVQERAEGLEKIAATGDTQQLPPGTATRMAIGAEIAPAHPAPIGTVWVGAEMSGGVDLASASPRGHDARWRGVGCLRVGVAGVRTGVAVRPLRETGKGCALTAALWYWGCGLRCRRAHGGGVAWPRPLEHEAQPYECDQRELIEEKRRHHGKTPSYTC